MTTLTIENYVKTIYDICLHSENHLASTGQVATGLAVSPGTVTSMLKTLSQSGLAAYTPYEGVRLTDAGRHLALRVIRRHRLIELFLVQTLGFSWDEVHEEAEHMEHAVSDLLVDRIDAFLGQPTHDPHGDPIPRADGSMTPHQTLSLAQLSAGQDFQLVRVLDQSPAFLRYLSESGLAIGSRGQVVKNSADARAITLMLPADSSAQAEVSFGHDVAEKLLVARV